MSYLPGIPHLPSSALKCPSQGTRPSLPPHVVAQRVPEYVVAQKAPGCNRSSRGRAVIESHRAFGFLGEAAFSGEAASFGAPSRLQKCSQKLHNASATAAAQPQNLVENLNSEVLHAFDCRVGPAEQMGACMAQVQHAPTGDSNKNTAAQAPSIALQLRKMAELLNPLCEAFPYQCTAAVTWETAGAQTRGMELRGFLCTMPKALYGRPPETADIRRLNPWPTGRRMVILCHTCLASPPSKLCPKVPIARNEAFNSPTRRCPKGSRIRRCPKGSRMQPKLQRPCSSRRSPRFRLLGRSRL